MYNKKYAGIAQVVEQLYRKQKVAGSSPAFSTIFPIQILKILGVFLFFYSYI